MSSSYPYDGWEINGVEFVIMALDMSSSASLPLLDGAYLHHGTFTKDASVGTGSDTSDTYTVTPLIASGGGTLGSLTVTIGVGDR